LVYLLVITISLLPKRKGAKNERQVIEVTMTAEMPAKASRGIAIGWET